MTVEERIHALIESNRVLKEASGEETPNMLIFEIAKIACAGIYTAGAAGNVTCKHAIVKIEKLLKDRRH